MAHVYNVVNAMKSVGYSLADMLPAYPGRDETYLNHLLRDTALASERFVIPYGLLGTKPCRSQYFNIHPGGFRSNGRPQAWPPDPAKTNIFFFGGSTVIGYCLEDEQTIPAQLQRRLEADGRACEVYNFGAGSYASRHTALRFMDLLDQGIRPDYAIFLDGYNDCTFGLGHRALVDALDTLFQQEKRLRRLSCLRAAFDYACARYKQGRRRSALEDSSILRTVEDRGVDRYLSDPEIARALDISAIQLPLGEIAASGVRLAERVWNGYLDSVALIRALAGRRRIKTFFVWQPVPWFATKREQRIMERLFYVYRHAVFCSPVYHWLHARSFPSLGDDPEFIDLSGAGVSLSGKLYSEIIHYSPMFCRKITEALSGALLSRRWFSDSTRQGMSN